MEFFLLCLLVTDDFFLASFFQEKEEKIERVRKRRNRRKCFLPLPLSWFLIPLLVLCDTSRSVLVTQVFSSIFFASFSFFFSCLLLLGTREKGKRRKRDEDGKGNKCDDVVNANDVSISFRFFFFFLFLPLPFVNVFSLLFPCRKGGEGEVEKSILREKGWRKFLFSSYFFIRSISCKSTFSRLIINFYLPSLLLPFPLFFFALSLSLLLLPFSLRRRWGCER